MLAVKGKIYLRGRRGRMYSDRSYSFMFVAGEFIPRCADALASGLGGCKWFCIAKGITAIRIGCISIKLGARLLDDLGPFRDFGFDERGEFGRC